MTRSDISPFAARVNATLRAALSVPVTSLLPIIDIKDAVVCPDFDEDCKDVADPEWCMQCIEPCIGICMELQRRQLQG